LKRQKRAYKFLPFAICLLPFDFFTIHICQSMKVSTTPSDKLKDIFSSARRVCVLTGAGVSAESGVPTFRGGGGTAVWKGMSFAVISSAEMVERDLDEVWAWFDYRRNVIKDKQPNPAHIALAEWQGRFEDFTLVTQNIDGLHCVAGSRDVIELHGNIQRARCIRCEKRYNLNKDAKHELDCCPACDSRVRPDVVLFGEFLPIGAFERASQKARACDLFFVIGTSALVYPAAALPEIAKEAGAYLVEINPELTPLSDICDEVLQGKAGEVLPLL
jgi:NAD-dependent deacetylase